MPTSGGNSAEAPRQKRGPKPRSKRNRKRPRSELHPNDDESHIQAQIIPLTLNNKPIPGGPAYLRLILPYLYNFTSYAKARWVGRTVASVYKSDFGGYSHEYYDMAIRQGRILVSDKRVDPSYIVKGTDILIHRVHRHEPGVAVHTNQPPYVRIAAETEDIVAVDKPGTIPIHPCGGYHQNSLMKLLERETDYGKLYTIHRLDRLTSGLVVLGKTSAVAQAWGKAIQQREGCEKLYVARVKGRFPNNLPAATIPCLSTGADRPVYGEWTAACDGVTTRRKNALGYWITDSRGQNQKDESVLSFSVKTHTVEACLEVLENNDPADPPGFSWLKLACPVRVAERKRGVCASGTFDELDDETYDKTVKSAQSAFTFIRYDEGSETSVILCKPETGRTHQLRLHLQMLGHPIANDPNYGGDIFFGNPEGEKVCRRAQQSLDDSSKERSRVVGSGEKGSEADSEVALVTSDEPATSNEVKTLIRTERGENEELSDFIVRTCVWCKRQNDPILEYLVRSPGLWLHALRYTVCIDKVRHSFRTSLPDWCLEVSTM